MKREVQYFFLVMLITFLYFRGVEPAWNEVHSDFANYYVSAKLVLEKEPLDRLYDNEWFHEEIAAHGINTLGKFAPFPPVTAWMMLPLANFNPLTAQRIFLLINLIFLLGCIRLLKEITSWDTLSCSLLVLGGGLSIANNIKFGQVYLIMTVAILFAMLLIKRSRACIAGAILGIFTSLKYFPVVYIGGYFLNGLSSQNKSSENKRNYFPSDLKVVLTSVIAISFILALEFLFFESAVMNEFFSSVLLPHLDGTLSGQGLYSFQFQSWDNLFRNLFVKDIQFNPSPMIDWPEGKTILKLMVSLAITIWSGLIIYRSRSVATNERISIYNTVLSLTALVLLPASATYHFVLLLIPVTLIIGNNLIEPRFIRIIIILYVIIGFTPYAVAFLAGKSWGLFFAYPRLWIVSAIYIIALYGISKKKELNSTL